MVDHMQLVEEKNQAYGKEEPDCIRREPLWREFGDYLEPTMFGYQVPRVKKINKKRKIRE